MKRTTATPSPRMSRKRSPQLSDTSITVRDRIVDTVRNIDRDEARVVAEVRDAIAQGLRSGGALVVDTASIIEEVVRGAVAATLQTGVGMLVTVKAVAKGVVLGVSDVGGDVLSAALNTARSVVEAAVAAGANVPAVAWRTVGGLVEAGAEVGANAGQIASAAARGALEGAGSAGRQATDVLQSGFVSVSQSIAQVFESAAGPAPPAPAGVAPGQSRRGARKTKKPVKRKVAASKRSKPAVASNGKRRLKTATGAKRSELRRTARG